MLIFFVHFGFGLFPCMYVKSLLSFKFLFHVCGVFGVILCEGLFFLRRGRCVLSYPSDALSDDITALISTAPTLAAAADSIATIQSGTDVVVSNFAGVEAVFDKLQAFLSELQSGHFYSPVGALMPFAGTSAYVPSGWLVCDGRSYAASGASADLQTVLNAAGFSALPDLQGRVVVGVGTNAAVDLVGDSDGISTVAYRRPQHKHSTTASTSVSISDPGHGHTNRASTVAGVNNSNDGFVRGTNIQDGGFANTNGNTTGITASASTSVTVGDQSTGTPTDVVPYLTLNYIIKN
jgi:microcystin-dependent protein